MATASLHRAVPRFRRGQRTSRRVSATAVPEVGRHRPDPPPGGARCRPAPLASGGRGEPGGGRTPGHAMLPAALRRWLHRPKVRAAAAVPRSRYGTSSPDGAAAIPGVSLPTRCCRWAPGAENGRGGGGAEPPRCGAVPGVPEMGGGARALAGSEAEPGPPGAGREEEEVPRARPVTHGVAVPGEPDRTGQLRGRPRSLGPILGNLGLTTSATT